MYKRHFLFILMVCLMSASSYADTGLLPSNFSYSPQTVNDDRLVNMLRIFTLGMKGPASPQDNWPQFSEAYKTDMSTFAAAYDQVLKICRLDIAKDGIHLTNKGDSQSLKSVNCAASAGGALYALMSSDAIYAYISRNPGVPTYSFYMSLRAELAETNRGAQAKADALAKQLAAIPPNTVAGKVQQLEAITGAAQQAVLGRRFNPKRGAQKFSFPLVPPQAGAQRRGAAAGAAPGVAAAVGAGQGGN
jgi:hypothetical protein